MYLNYEMFLNHIALPVNGLLSEFETEHGGILLRLQALRQYDGFGNLRVDGDLRPIPNRKLFLRAEVPTYRLREGVMYEPTFAMRFTEPLPPGVVARIEPANRAVDAGLDIVSPTLTGEESVGQNPPVLLTATMTARRRTEIDGMFPIAVLRFLSVDLGGMPEQVEGLDDETDVPAGQTETPDDAEEIVIDEEDEEPAPKPKPKRKSRK